MRLAVIVAIGPHQKGHIRERSEYVIARSRLGTRHGADDGKPNLAR
jgi:hypothetical protein